MIALIWVRFFTTQARKKSLKFAILKAAFRAIDINISASVH